MKSLSEQVNEVFLDCLYRNDEVGADKKPPADAVIVEGLVATYGLHPTRLESHREKVRWFLNEMPAPFHKSTGGGWSFLNLCVDRNEEQWAEHPTMEQLVVLAIGLHMGSYCVPRELWGALPGSVPYVQFDTSTPNKEGT